MGVSIFFLLGGGGEGEFKAPGGVGGGWFLLRILEGGFSQERGGVPALNVPLHKHLHATAFGFADAQVDLALAEIEKGLLPP